MLSFPLAFGAIYGYKSTHSKASPSPLCFCSYEWLWRRRGGAILHGSLGSWKKKLGVCPHLGILLKKADNNCHRLKRYNLLQIWKSPVLMTRYVSKALSYQCLSVVILLCFLETRLQTVWLLHGRTWKVPYPIMSHSGTCFFNPPPHPCPIHQPSILWRLHGKPMSWSSDILFCQWVLLEHLVSTG